jgi:hypothetical protein
MAKGGAPLSSVPKGMRKGLKSYGAGKKTEDIASDLEGKDIDDPKALAVWIRRRALGESKFKKHQKWAREK